jgi:uridylate kinase
MSRNLSNKKAAAAKSRLIVISLGGSIIVPKELDIEFLKNFKALIEKYIRKGNRFIIVAGGGYTCRHYQNAASKVTKLDKEDLDWLGIHATRLNAHLLRTIFWKHANPVVLKDPTRPLRFKEELLIAAGWKPGFSTDYDTVLLARRFGADTILNLSNQDYVYTKDPRKHADATPITEVSWKQFRRIVGNRWDPGMNVPFDPVASKEAEKDKMTVIMLNGTNLKNLDELLSGRKFKGTIIS